MLRPFPNLVAFCYVLSAVVAQNLKPVKLLSQELPTFLLFRDGRSVAQQCEGYSRAKLFIDYFS